MPHGRGMEEHLTVGRVAELAGVSVRTLHHYDEIGLVRPSARTAAGYRAYSAGDVERLREVLGYRRLGFGLREIADLVDDPATDAVAHLRRLRGLLLDQRDRAAAMVTAIDTELTHCTREEREVITCRRCGPLAVRILM